jgi:hypothetical protein
MNTLFIIVVILSILIVGYFVLVKEKKEDFSLPNFIQVFPECGDAPLNVSFVPIYINESMNFTIDFGDNSKHISNSLDDVYGVYHIYKNAGIYNGSIIFKTSKNDPIKQQNFTINVK